MTVNRRDFMVAAGALVTVPEAARAHSPRSGGGFPPGFLWGCSTAGHQVEGNNVGSDFWVLENVKPTIFTEPSGDAANSFELWPVDLDLVKGFGLNSYRFSLEWSRIEPVEGAFSRAMLDHYKNIVEGCRIRGIAPVVTFNHYSLPAWAARAGAWSNPSMPGLFARFCERAARHIGGGIARAVTLNEPNIGALLRANAPGKMEPPAEFTAMLAAAAEATGEPGFGFGMVGDETADANLIAAHKAGRQAIKSVLPNLPVGVSIALSDEQAVGAPARRDRARSEAYGVWFEAARGDDFIGIQNYTRTRWDADGKMASPADAVLSVNGSEVYPPSLANAVRYAYQMSGCPVLVTEHGVGTDDDRIRAKLIPAALEHLKVAIDEGVPVIGYMHWSLLDNFEWVSGFAHRYGLCSVDRNSFRRTPKPSAAVLGAIATRNGL